MVFVKSFLELLPILTTQNIFNSLLSDFILGISAIISFLRPESIFFFLNYLNSFSEISACYIFVLKSTQYNLVNENPIVKIISIKIKERRTQ